jgi:DNA-binding CsgD family transcriptional regulator/pimeloyl-ACP methyl ester carboxylesterase
MGAPPVQYVTTSDGLSIAYAVSGKGTSLLFLPGAAFYHVQLAWEYPRLQDWMQGLSLHFRLIQLDPRGFGMSSRAISEDLARQDYQKDIEAVIDQLKPGRFVLAAVSTGVDLAIDYALEHQEQIIGLVLGTSWLRYATALFDTLPSQDWDAFIYSITPRDRSLDERERIVQLRRQAFDQRNYLLFSRVMYGQPEAYAVKTERLLSGLRTPTLVLHTRDYPHIPVEQAMKKAQLTRGRLVLIDGTDPWGNADQGIRAIEAFLADLPQPGTSNAQRPSELSSREVEVLRLVAAGKSNQQIADELVISRNTVRRHVSNIFDKTGVTNRAQAVAYARDHGVC